VIPLLRRRWRSLVVGAVLGAAIGFLVAHTASASADVSTSRVLLSIGPTVTRSSSPGANQYVNQRIATDAELVTSDAVLSPAARDLGVAVSDLSSRVAVSAPDDASVITIAVRGSSPENARRSAQAVTDAFVRTLPTLETPDPAQPARLTARVVGEPSLPGARPSPVPATAVGAVAGVLLVAVAATIGTSGRVRRRRTRVRAWMTADTGDGSLRG
jgi:capsular polysaccharide biosynthesis protein